MLKDHAGVGHEVVEHLGAAQQFVVALGFLVEEPDGFGVAGLCFVETLALPIEIAEPTKQDAFLGGALCGADAAEFVGFERAGGVARGEVDVARGVIDAVEIVFVVLVTQHAFEAGKHFLRALRGGDGLGLEHTGLEGQFVGRTLRQTAI